MTVWVVITRDADRNITDLEVLDRPPVWFLRPLGQVCFTGYINGGDSTRYDNTPDIIRAVDAAGVRFEDWRDVHGNRYNTGR